MMKCRKMKIMCLLYFMTVTFMMMTTDTLSAMGIIPTHRNAFSHLQRSPVSIENGFSFSEINPKLTACLTDYFNITNEDKVRNSYIRKCELWNRTGLLDRDPPRSVVAFWFGSKLSGTRLKNLQEMEKIIGVPVLLLGEENIENYEIDTFPYHPSVRDYHYLKGEKKHVMSAVHLSDYFRSYVMFHFGGGYADIKPRDESWVPYFEELEKDRSAYMIGTQELHDYYVGCNSEVIKGENFTCIDMVKNYKYVYCNGQYIFRRRTELAGKWHHQVNLYLDNRTELLRRYPAPHNRCCMDNQREEEWDSAMYPIGWVDMGGAILHIYEYKYRQHTLHGLPMFDRTQPYIGSQNED